MNMAARQTPGRKIRDLRLETKIGPLEKPMTQRQLAEKVGVDPITVSRWERDEVPPSEVNRVMLARLFGKHPDEFRSAA
jgi:transcriptional regulator with XRE-family HTH domain